MTLEADSKHGSRTPLKKGVSNRHSQLIDLPRLKNSKQQLYPLACGLRLVIPSPPLQKYLLWETSINRVRSPNGFPP